MKPAPFRHYAPTSVGEAVALLARLAPDHGRALAGGQSLAQVERALVGQSPGPEAFRAAGERAAAVDPTEYINNTAEYRRDLVSTVMRRALEQAAA